MTSDERYELMERVRKERDAVYEKLGKSMPHDEAMATAERLLTLDREWLRLRDERDEETTKGR